ncbi:3'-5' exonuclease [Hymenobacter sp. BT523]|uniref:3'-5' exonuclease n=1 Tax=Hymenobacter sp. BT523 TaxID=2795725 RepID=UPI0018EB66E6|nr:3'-5' exonuclease [Hymenobacter sp. BT523]MBJ6108040.1 3'-5' exonuclease [Hymenobacter sp. BT523]
MKDYLLFVDTETSGIPRDWTKPYASRKNWPHIVQLAWVVCTPDGREIKAENHYIQPSDYDMSPESGRVHGLTVDFLRANGRPRHAVMQRLHRDLLHYQPLVVAHFMQLDFHMMGVGFHRAGLKNPLLNLPTFCTMRATSPLVRHPTQGFLRLGELYQRLFHEPLENAHDAMVDVRATARCYFEMRRQGLITDETVARQEPVTVPEPRPAQPLRPKRLRIGVAPWLLLGTVALLLLAFFLIG